MEEKKNNNAYDIVKNMMKHNKPEVPDEVEEKEESPMVAEEKVKETTEKTEEAFEDMRGIFEAEKEFSLFDDAVSDDLELSDEDSRYLISESLRNSVTGKETKVRYVEPSAFSQLRTAERALDVQKELLKALNRGALGQSSYAEVIAAQSGYSCKIKPLTNADSFRIFNSKGTLFDNEDMTFRTIYDKILEFSCGPMSYSEWLSRTSLGDLESFYYGLYCATFIDEGTFKFECTNPKCNKISEAIIRNKSLIRVANYDEMKQLEEKIAKESKSQADRERLSLINEVRHIILSDTGLGIEIKCPTLADILYFYKTTSTELYTKFSAIDIHSMLYVSGILVPTGDPGSWYPITDKTEIIGVFDKLTIGDAAELRTAIKEQLDKRHVSFAISEIKCDHCKKTIRNVPLNLRDILFTLISEKRQ